MVVEVDIAKLQARVKELYKDGNASNHEKIQEISRKARSPGNLVICLFFSHSPFIYLSLFMKTYNFFLKRKKMNLI